VCVCLSVCHPLWCLLSCTDAAPDPLLASFGHNGVTPTPSPPSHIQLAYIPLISSLISKNRKSGKPNIFCARVASYLEVLLSHKLAAFDDLLYLSRQRQVTALVTPSRISSSKLCGSKERYILSALAHHMAM